MTTAAVSADQRYTRQHPCPICGGCERDPRGEGRRCIGYLSGDGAFARCSRSEHAGRVEIEGETDSYVHWLAGDCRCGARHDGRAGARALRAGEPVATYDYRDESTTLLYQVVRVEPKGFKQRRPGPGGPEDWIWSLGDVRRVLYRLPDLLAADPSRPVFIAEGERDVENLIARGLVATCNSGGAGKWRREYAEPLRGRRVVILPDNDDAGRKHAAAVRAALDGVAGGVVVLELDGLPPKGDVSDWLAAGHDAEELLRLASRGSSAPSGPSRAHVVRLVDIAPREVEWLWPARLPAGMVALLDGDGGMGKSTVVIDLAARLTTGRPLPNEALVSRPPVDVVMLGHEDSPQHTIRPRLDAAGADVRRVHLLADVGGRMPQLPTDAGEIERVVRETGARLLVIDPISAYIGRVDLHRDNEVRDALNPLVLIAERTGVAILMLRHLRKSGGTNAIHRGLGSVAIMAVARTGMMLLRDPEDKEARILAWPKLTVATSPSSLRWRWIVGDGAPKVSWEGVCEMSADEILSRQDRDAAGANNDGKVHDAEQFLKRELADGPKKATEVEAAAKQAGISATGALRRARSALVETEKRRDGCWWWRLRTGQDEQAPPGAKDAPLARLAHLQEEQEKQEEQDYRSREAAHLGGEGVEF